MSVRLRDWQPRLAALIAARAHEPFAYGVHDCALFAADAVESITGIDPAADLRASYASAAEARALLAAMGGLAALVDARLPRIAVARAQVGDIGLLRHVDRELLGVCTGGHYHAPGTRGLLALPAPAVFAAWGVGHA